LVVQTNGANNLSIPSNNSYTFATLPNGTAFTVTVLTQPTSPSQVCTVTNGTGTINGARVTNVAINCVTSQYTVGGTITGTLTGTGLTLKDTVSGHTLLVPANSATFAIVPAVNSGASYNVTITGQPASPTETCTIASGAAGVVGTSNVTSVVVHCAISTFTVGGTISGYTGTGLVLKEATSAQTVTPANAATTFTFTTPVNSGAAYTVSVLTEPNSPVQNCTVTNASKTGTVTTANVTSVIVDCSGLYVFAASPTDGSAGSLAAFTIDPVAGGLTAAAGSPYDVSLTSDVAPWGVAVDPSGLYLYVSNSGSASISTDGIGAGGVLTLDPAAPATTVVGSATAANTPYSLLLDPTGGYLYTGTNDAPNGLVEGFSITAGALAPLTGSPYTSGTPAAINVPFGLALDTTDSFLYAVNNYADTVVSYGITAGVLAELSASPVTPGALVTPYAVATYPIGTYFYVTDTGTTPGTVSVVTIDGTGAVTVVSSHNVGTTPQAVVVDPAGKHLYVSNAGDGTVSAFTISGGGATLTGGITGSPFTAGGAASSLPTALAIDSSGRFLYVANGTIGTISGFAIAAGGGLTPVPNSPFLATLDALGSTVGPVGVVTQ
jgi:DNA-binding beta-propeller fold protein YncE